MNNFSSRIVSALREAGHDATINPTGGGCEEIGFQLDDNRFVSITDGDASLPDGTEFDGITALVQILGSDGEETRDPIGINSYDPADIAQQVDDAI